MSEARLHVPTMLNVLGLTLALPGEMKRFEGELHKVAGASVGEVMQPDPRRSARTPRSRSWRP